MIRYMYRTRESIQVTIPFLYQLWYIPSADVRVYLTTDEDQTRVSQTRDKRSECS